MAQTKKKRGRPPGAKNKATIEREKAIKEYGITPLDYMLSIVCDNGQDQQTRLDAAKAAAPYVHPRLATIEQNNTGEQKHTHSFDKQSVEQAVEKIRAAMDTIRAGDTEETA